MKKTLFIFIILLAFGHLQAQNPNDGGYRTVAPNVDSYLLPKAFTECTLDLYFYNGELNSQLYYTDTLVYVVCTPAVASFDCESFRIPIYQYGRKIAQPYYSDSLICIKGISALTTYYLDCQEETGFPNEFLLLDNNAKIFYEIMDSTLTQTLASVDVTNLLYSNTGCYYENYIPKDTNVNYHEGFFEHPITISGKFYAVFRVFDELNNKDAGICYKTLLGSVHINNDRVISCIDEFPSQYLNLDNQDWNWYPSPYGTELAYIFPILGENVDIDDVEKNNTLSIFPNPAKDEVFVASAEKINHIDVLDMSGKTIKSIDVNALEVNIDISSFEKGTYMLKVYTDKNIETKKIVKE